MEEKGVIQDVLTWDEVVVRCNWDSKRRWLLVSKIMKIIDETETQKKKKKKKTTSFADIATTAASTSKFIY